jgi:hypothetical protein
MKVTNPANNFLAIFAGSIDFGIYLRIAAVLGIFVLLWFLAAMFRRETVKRDLRQRGCKPKYIWWMVFAWWSPWYDAMPFRVVYIGQDGSIHKAYCWVGHWLMDSPISPRRVRWIKDEIVGEIPLPEVWASDEIIRKKLKERDSQGDNLLDE